MVTLTNAENALKTVYLGVVSNQLNTNANPLLSRIRQTTSDVWGKDIKKLALFGLNGGVGAGSEDGSLPTAGSNNYAQFTSTLKNLYGRIEISDKAIRASSNNAGAFVNLLNAEMERLINASAFNFGRMLYGDGSGILATVSEFDLVDTITVNSVKALMEGMIIDTYTSDDDIVASMAGARITYVDRVNKKIKLSVTVDPAVASGHYFTVQNSKNLELSGLGKLFGNSTSLYGVTRADYTWMTPYSTTSSDGSISDTIIQEAIDYLEEFAGSDVDFITCSSSVKRLYQEYLSTYRRNIDILELNGGYKAISYNGIPVISDRFVADGDMYLLNTKEFSLHQLCDWKWLEAEDGRVIKQIPGYATYSATLVKYADLICNKPSGQAKISGLTGTV